VLREPGVLQRASVMSCRRKLTATLIRGELGVWGVHSLYWYYEQLVLCIFVIFYIICMFAMLRYKDMPICLSTCKKWITTKCIFVEYYLDSCTWLLFVSMSTRMILCTLRSVLELSVLNFLRGIVCTS
jgi:hypothetical protein